MAKGAPKVSDVQSLQVTAACKMRVILHKGTLGGLEVSQHQLHWHWQSWSGMAAIPFLFRRRRAFGPSKPSSFLSEIFVWSLFMALITLSSVLFPAILLLSSFLAVTTTFRAW